jgi:AraC-like DNA-binding protein
VALALGYYDQAHMINSVREIMGQTPGRIAARESVGNFQ